MAIDYGAASGNKMLKSVAKKNTETLNSIKVVNLELDLIDENPDNEHIFNMDDIDALAKSIEEEGFSGAIEVFKKPDGRYEISAGHRRYQAMKRLGRKTIPAIVSASVDNISRAKKLLSSNINNRVLTPLDMARAVEYYKENVLKPSGFKGNMRQALMDFFNKSGTQIHRYEAIMKMIPELQELSNNPMFPFTAFTSAATMTKEQQYELYRRIIQYNDESKSGDGFEISRTRIEQIITNIRMEDERKRQKLELENDSKGSKKEVKEVKTETSGEENSGWKYNQEQMIANIGDFYGETSEADEYTISIDDITETILNQLRKIIEEKYDIKDKTVVKKQIDDIRKELNVLEMMTK